MKNRIIWDDCTPTADRRPITQEDIEEDIHIEESEDKEEILDTLIDLSFYDRDELEDYLEGDDSDEAIIHACLNMLNDPGDGSPNIIYLKVDGIVYEEGGYDLEDLDPDTCSEDDVKEVLKKGVEEDEARFEDIAQYSECIDELNNLNLSEEQYDYYREALNEITFEDKPSIKNGHGYTSFEDVMEDARNASRANDEEDDKDFEFTITLFCDGEADNYKKLEHHMDYLLPGMADGDLEVWGVEVDDSDLERVVVKGHCNDEDFEIDIDGWPHIEDFDVDVEEK